VARGGARGMGGLDSRVSAPIQFNTTASNRPIEARIHGRITAQGRLAPVLTIPLQLRQLNARDSAQLRLLSVSIEALCGGEVLGRATLAGITLNQNTSNTIEARIPTEPRLLDWVTDHVVRDRVGRLVLKLYGAIQFRDTPNDPWVDEDVKYLPGTDAVIEISRSDWHDHVLTPIRRTDYLYLEVELARATVDGWEPALTLLQQAEDAYALGDDSSVFLRLRGCLDALPGAKQAIVDAVTDPVKRKGINDLTRAVGNFLHLGRHVSTAGSPEPGTFPVNRVDASCALALMKVLLAYLSTANPRGPQPD
jgi:hypothetical protein